MKTATTARMTNVRIAGRPEKMALGRAQGGRHRRRGHLQIEHSQNRLVGRVGMATGSHAARFGLDGRQMPQDVGPQFLVGALAGLQDGRLGRAVVLVAGAAGLRIGRDPLPNLLRVGRHDDPARLVVNANGGDVGRLGQAGNRGLHVVLAIGEHGVMRRPLDHSAGPLDVAPHQTQEMVLGGPEADGGVAGQDAADRQKQRHQEAKTERLEDPHDHHVRLA